MQKPQSGALFDVKPVDESGNIDFERISALQPVVNLASRKKLPVKKNTLPRIDIPQPEVIPPKKDSISVDRPMGVHEEFESAINENADIHFELANYGIQSHSLGGKPRYRPILKVSTKSEARNPKEGQSSYYENLEAINEYSAILAEIHQSRSEVSRVPEMAKMVALEKPVRTSDTIAQMPVQLAKVSIIPKPKIKNRRPLFKFRKKTLVIGGAIILGLLVLLVAGWGLKRHVTAEGQSALNQLETAKADLESMKFESASEDFVKAYQSFSKAGDGLNFMGATIGGLIASLPGGGAVKSAQNLVEIGKLLADSGAAMTEAAKALTNAGAVFTPGNTSETTIASVMSKLQKALAISAADIKDIKALLADTDQSIIPADKREAFAQLSALVPTIEQVVSQGAGYAKFFADASGLPGTHRYLILFENSSEIRPTGGFPGSYGVVTFKDGKLEDFFVDDIYNPDGQIQEPIVPPGPLQHITPDWGMRDANWFVDFPTSARVIQDFYKLETGQTVEGVITINPSIVTEVLKIIGPVAMPKYGLTLGADNFVTSMQNQIEYVADRAQPKQVLKDFAPLLMDKLRKASSDQWMAIFNSVIASMDKNSILMYFDNLSLETFADNQGFAGQVYQGPGDYVMPVLSNVKGSKTDAVTDTSFSLTTNFEGDDAIHTLTITRVHNGGNEKYAFYNKQNPAYVRVLVPEGSQLVGIEGNNKPNFAPMLNYAKAGFNRVETLTKWESSAVKDASSGVTTYKESGKSEFGFWLITDPGQTKTVSLTYRVPGVIKNGGYSLYLQKQPGLVIKDMKVEVGKYKYSGPLEKDLKVSHEDIFK